MSDCWPCFAWSWRAHAAGCTPCVDVVQVEARLRQLEGRSLASDAGNARGKAQPSPYSAAKQAAGGSGLAAAAAKAYNADADVVEPVKVGIKKVYTALRMLQAFHRVVPEWLFMLRNCLAISAMLCGSRLSRSCCVLVLRCALVTEQLHCVTPAFAVNACG